MTTAGRKRWFYGLGTGLAAALAVAAALAASRPPSETPPCSPAQRQALDQLAREVRGVLAYQREDDRTPERICISVLGSRRCLTLSAHGRFPRWSPDGSRIAFIRDRKVMLMSAAGRSVRELAEAQSPEPIRAVAYHPSGEEVLFTDGETIRAVNIRSRALRTVVSGRTFVNLDLSADARRLIATARGHEIHAYNLETGEHRHLGRGCSANLSPDGQRYTRNSGRHQYMSLCRWEDDVETGRIEAPAPYTIDNEYWSNHPDWVVVRTEHPTQANLYVCDVERGRTVQATFSGDCNRPDLHVFMPPTGWRAGLKSAFRRLALW